MISFLRKFRIQNLNSGRLGRYVLYAIGEIVLVVIGILIALAVNNRNENNKALEQSRATLRIMLDDLKSDTTYLTKMLSDIESHLAVEEWFTNKETIAEKDIDSIMLASANLNWAFSINDRSFQNLQSSAEKKLVGFEELYNEISSYYIVTKNRITNNNQLERSARSRKTEFQNVLNENLILSTTQYSDYSGFNMKINRSNKVQIGDFNKIKDVFDKLSTKNELFNQSSRHNYIYFTLTMSNAEAKRLIRKIEVSLNEKN